MVYRLLRITCCLPSVVCCVLLCFQCACAEEELTGLDIMQEVFKRHETAPFVFEEQSVILMDKAGNHDVRVARRFSRTEKEGTAKYLFTLDNPAELRGVALLAALLPSGGVETGVYLPALGKELVAGEREDRGGRFLDTDFSLADLVPEALSDFRYSRAGDARIKTVTCFVVEAYPLSREIERSTGYSFRRHLIRQDNFTIARTDYFNLQGRLFKRQTRHDLKKIDNDMWKPNMILMEDFENGHKTLIKINSRIFSQEYVQREIFTPAWLFENRHVRGVAGPVFEEKQ
ncbi:MAG: outer membrane lipoprotein-sorting protein [Nitrospinae bacterium]|nr:outer membrane lipoprotein-sorting protein [Nitrospinota bacterium]